MPSDLELAVYRTVAYFAYFKYPLTSFEIWKWLLEPSQTYTFSQLVEILEQSEWLGERLKSTGGFYGLDDMNGLITNRRNRLVNALKKYAKLSWIMKIVGSAPYLDGVAVCNSLAFHHTLPKSDIDLFLVSRPGRIWSSRLFATLPLILLRQRPGERPADPVCLSFFVTPNAFSFENLKIGERDPYLAYWCQALIPLLDRSNWVSRFFEDNAWLRTVLPNAYPVKRAKGFRLSSGVRFPTGVMSEDLAKKVQEDRFPKTIRDMRNKDTRVVVNEHMLKFHEHDRREEIKNAMENRLAEVL